MILGIIISLLVFIIIFLFGGIIYHKDKSDTLNKILFHKRVIMIDPQGVPGYVYQYQIDQAKAAGWRLIDEKDRL